MTPPFWRSTFYNTSAKNYFKGETFRIFWKVEETTVVYSILFKSIAGIDV